MKIIFKNILVSIQKQNLELFLYGILQLFFESLYKITFGFGDTFFWKIQRTLFEIFIPLTRTGKKNYIPEGISNIWRIK